MSHTNPTIKEVLNNSTGLEVMRTHLGKSYLNLVKGQFHKTHKRKATIEDSQELYNIYESMWRDHYIDKPARVKANKLKGIEIWNFGCSYKIDVFASMCRFLEYFHNHTSDIRTPGFKSCADLMKELNIEFLETYIIDNKLFMFYRDFAITNMKLFPWYRRTYQDFSHQAYNNSADDF